ncbi:MAG: HDOD domain-containing protein [Myxococcaceae bacterium]
MIGTTVLNYRIGRQLGAGGLGVVYEGEHTLIGRKAALKVLNPQVAGDKNMVARFLAEARAVNAIRHPNIVDVTDYGEANGHFIIVMELLEGETLAERIEARAKLDEKLVVGFLSQTASAVGAAHESGIVHRDLKPENLFLTKYPDYPDFIKVLDFGIAKLLHAQGNGQRTTPGLIIGTPAYMSPEQCLGEESLDHRSDIYSLGVVAWRLLTGKLPFEGNAMQMMHGHLGGTIAPLTSFGVSEHVSRIVMRCVARAPEERFQTMKELRLALFSLGARPPIAFSAEEAPSPPRAAPPPPPPAPARASSPTAASRNAETRPPLSAAPAPAPASPTGATTARMPEAPTQTDEKERMQAIALATKLKDIISKRLQADSLKLPSLPDVAMKAMELAHDPDVRFGAIASQLEKDPFVSSRLLRVANSPLFGGMARATSMESVVSRLGIKQLLGLLQELAAEQVYASKDPVIRNAFRGIWEHCLGVAHVSRDLAGQLKSLDPNTAYLGGLFHDIGKPVVAALLLEVERASPASFISGAVWQRAIEECHRDVGAIIAFRWFLPREVAGAVADQDHYDFKRGRASCANVVRLANALCQREGLDVRAQDPALLARVIVQGRQLMQLSDEQLEQSAKGIVQRIASLTDANGDAEGGSTRVFDRTGT